MREEITTITNGHQVVEVSRLCTVEGVGDFEVIPFRDLSLDLRKFCDCYRKIGYILHGEHNDSCLFNINDADITLFKDGRIILEGVYPDNFDKAMELVEMVYNPPSIV